MWWWLLLVVTLVTAEVDAKRPSTTTTNQEPVIEEVTAKQLERILSDKDYVAVFWYARSCTTCDKVLQELEQIDDDTDSFGVDFVKINDKRLAKQYGITKFPALTYFREKEPIIYEGDLMDEEQVLDFLTSLEAMDLPDRIEEVNARILDKIVEDTDFVAVLFYDHGSEESTKVLDDLEHIDDDCDKYGIQFVKIDDTNAVKEYGLDSLPTLVYFEKGIPNIYDGDLEEETEILEWLVEQLEKDEIEDVTDEMLDKLIHESKFLAVLFYDDDDKKSQKVLNELENIDDECDQLGIVFVKIDNDDEAKEYGIEKIPALVYFEQGIPTIYEGNLEDEEKVLKWLEHQVKHDEIEDVTDEMLDLLIKRKTHVAVLFYKPECKKCSKVLQELENIDDEADQLGIGFVKINDESLAEEYNLGTLPALVYYRHQIPIIYEGELTREDDVLEWLVQHKSTGDEDDTIEDVTLKTLSTLISSVDHLAVLFCKVNKTLCPRILRHIELIDDEASEYGIKIVKMKDRLMAKKYGFRDPPGITYFRKSKPINYDGDIDDEEEILDWLSDPENMELTDHIERVNRKMFDKIRQRSDYVAVFLYDEDCPECDMILENLEEIDNEADLFGIDFVKICSAQAAADQGLHTLPALMYFRKKKPMVYDGDLSQSDRVLEWLTSQDVFEIKNEIEEVNKKMLEKLLEENEYVTVFFYEIGSDDSKSILEKLENIDSETDNFDITFVKMADARYARKWGVTHLPAIVYFRRRFPSIYRGDLHSEADVLEWLRKNRFRQPELNLFMYALMAIIVAFLIYTAFLLQCFKTPTTTAVVAHTKQS
uniref:Protein disulfide-isomerase n=1 Tax=Diabrotica virgifera virgifera TaxID=50390 RepID=A0A6P7G5Q2_DIAVI